MGALALAALVPLYGDPRSSAVTHAEWARMLLRALEMDEIIPATGHASQAFETLSWKNSLSFPGDRYLRASGMETFGEGPTRRIVASGGEGEAVYPLAVLRGGDYTLRVRLAGNPAAPATAQITAIGETVPKKEFVVVPSSVAGWVDAGSLHLDPGAYTATIVAPQGTALERVEFRPPCVGSVEPLEGWRPTAILQATDLAVTTLKALDLESELPPAADPVEVAGSDFRTPGGAIAVSTRGAGGKGQEGLWLKAGPSGLQAVVFVELPEAGLYSVDTFGIKGGGQSWLADACRKAVLCTQAATTEGTRPTWQHIMTAEFGPGRHFFTVTLGAGAVIERLRLERKKDSPADYLATLKRLGFDAGPDGPVARPKAVDAMKFIRGRRATTFSEPCGDPLAGTNTVIAQTGFPAASGPVTGPGITPPFTGTTPLPGAGTPGPIPPQIPASSTTP
jgi:hypothetical protein